jgi:hypothetical protein
LVTSLSVAPSSSTTVSVALCCPGVWKAWVTTAPWAAAPSLKDHDHDTIEPSGSDEPVPLNETDVSVCVKIVGPASAFGGRFGRVVDEDVLVDEEVLVDVEDVAVLGVVLEVLVVLGNVVDELLDVDVLVVLDDVVVVEPVPALTVTRATSESQAQASSRTQSVTS